MVSKRIVLVDVDGTLTPARRPIEKGMSETLKKLKAKSTSEEVLSIGVVGGSDLDKQKEQLGVDWGCFDYNFAENGVVAYKSGELIASTSIAGFLGEEKIKQ